MKKLCNVYEVYDEFNALFMKGFKSDVAYVLDITESGVDSVCRNQTRAKGKYLIKFVGKEMKYYSRCGVPVNKRPEPLKRKETFVERYGDLEKYGNTLMSRDEYKRHQELIEDKGYKVRYTKKRDRRGVYYRLDVI